MLFRKNYLPEMKRAFLFLILLTFFLSARAQTDKEKAHALGREAIQLMDNGNIKASLRLLEKAEKLDPGNINYPYEKAYAHYLDKDYESAIKMLKKLTKHEKVNDLVWQLLGNSYDMVGKPAKAIESYDQGLELFPESGILHLERGNMELFQENYTEALAYYENGIEVAPQFPSNYYWASKIFLSSSEEIWGMIYGEIFMNLERNSKRTVEISKLLYDTYQSEIKISSDTAIEISFCQQNVMTIDDLGEGEKLKLPFCMVYETTMLLSLAFDSVNMENLNILRTRFVDRYFEEEHQKDYPNVLFDFQQKIAQAGQMEAYNYWILMMGDENAFGEWQEANPDKWNSFVAWFTENPLRLDQKHRFYRMQY
jgi:tetratricopeptide (TPR) repeat protein